ncbi:hypothetical protein DCS_02514 [Drechmeria coniospora]|uniref:Rhodanese domain-containing protein n=1 Tax=Drechmeria coniospora TaxID=98403 RepID=A0A151GWG5_DRECN|nr:hypothetical protein DCS_02514 [Drechmeria coniospora]KYK61372.1 hypothetical protein DCS_02514 [Drechmeria coniospora]ODA81135.1 hypothetical protein RJ55_04098 [Drechmeria coniospora]
MSSVSIATVQRMSAKTLSEMMLHDDGGASDRPFAVIDVRDDDFIGGHIKGATNVPSAQLDVMMPTLLRKLADKRTVIFHCALSQQRGPTAALRYLRERERLAVGGEPKQDVFVLDRGFHGWQQVYGTDERLTEAYRKELWEDL